MRMLITFALKPEFSPWSSRHPFVPYEFENWERRREFDLFKANIGPDEVTVLLTGMGKENATRAMSSLPIELHDVCISAGLAGSLESSFKPGDVVAARTAETLDENCRVACDPNLFELALATGAKPVQVTLTSAKIASTVQEKEDLSRQGSIVEMESTFILAAARQCNVPAIVVRAISDAADEDLPVNFQRVLDSHGHLRMGGLLKEVGLSPYRIPLLIQFGRQSRAAAKSLADFLDPYISTISRNWASLAHSKIEEFSAT
jgi:adenosylhomocysteine nucleosidase